MRNVDFVVDDSTGEKACYSQWRGLSIIFHAATLIPFDNEEPQQVSAVVL